jgi:hypothetical protein
MIDERLALHLCLLTGAGSLDPLESEILIKACEPCSGLSQGIVVSGDSSLVLCLLIIFPIPVSIRHVPSTHE